MIGLPKYLGGRKKASHIADPKPIDRSMDAITNRVRKSLEDEIEKLGKEAGDFTHSIMHQPPAGVDLCMAAIMRLARIGAMREGLVKAVALTHSAITDSE